MKIASLRWTTYRLPFRAPYVTARGAVTYREGLIIELTAEDGLAGLGEAAPVPEADVSGDALSRTLATLAPRLLRRQPNDFDVKALLDSDEAGRALACAVDTAACDLLARHRGVSVAHFLSPNAAAAVAVNALVTAPSPESAARDAAEARVAGFGAVKLKVGTAASLDEERRRVAAVREALGPDVKLRLDANGAWGVDQAIEAIRALAAYRVEYVEQPIAPGNLESLRRVQDAVATPVAADEDVTSPEAARRLLDAGAAHVLVLKPQRLGGLRPSREVIDAATAAGVKVVVTTSIESGVGTAACLHLAASLPDVGRAHGLATLDLLEDDLILDSGLPIVKGCMRLPEGPGLGVRLDEAALARYSDGWREAG